MSKRAKHLCLVILAQAACVAVGLWMEHQYVKSCVYQAAEEEARSDMEARANDFRSAVESHTLESLAPGTPAFDWVNESLAAKRPPRGGAMIVDREWRVVASAVGPDLGQPPGLEIGRRISWKQSASGNDQALHALRGTLDLPDGPHIAAAAPLDRIAGYVVVHRSVADVTTASATLVRSLPALSGITFLWTMTLLSAVVYLVLVRFHDDVDRQRKQAAADTLRQTQNLVRTRDAVIFGLAKLADSRDPDTGDHLERISTYSTMLSSALRRHPKFCNAVTPAFIKLIGISSALHDIGKVGLEDGILLKPGPLATAERARMQTHVVIGGKCLREIEQRLGSSNFLQMAREIALAHHERWDGTGYPKGLSGAATPLAARIVAIADVYDALSTKRVYKPALPHEECVAIIRSQMGKHFDPDLVDVWLTIESKFRDIAVQYASASPDIEETRPGAERDKDKHDCREEILVSSVATGE